MAGCQTVTPGSGPGAVCGRKIDFDQVWTDETLVLSATNRCFIPMCVRVDFPELSNLESPGSLPIEAVLDVGESVDLAELQRTEPGKRSPFTSRIELSPLSCSPAHADAQRYEMPFGGEESRMVSQGVDGETTHQGDMRYSFDFAMPVGTPVLAARQGYVVEVIDEHGPGSADPAFMQRSNVVLIGHADGSIAQYSHLSRDIPVRPGDVVRRGQEIARSGNSGYTHGPHLHFAVSVQASDGRYRTVPVRFENGLSAGLVPLQGRAYAPANSPASVPAAPE